MRLPLLNIKLKLYTLNVCSIFKELDLDHRYKTNSNEKEFFVVLTRGIHGINPIRPQGGGGLILPSLPIMDAQL